MDTGCADSNVLDLDVENLKVGDIISVRIIQIIGNGAVHVSIGSFDGVLFSPKLRFQSARESNNNGTKFEESTEKSLSQDQLSPAQQIARNRDLRTKTEGEVMPRPVETRSTYGIKHPNQPEVKWSSKRQKTRAEALAEKNHKRSAGGMPSHGSNCTCVACVELRNKLRQVVSLKPAQVVNKRHLPEIPVALIHNSSSKMYPKQPNQNKVLKSSNESNKLNLSQPEDNSKSSLKVKISSTSTQNYDEARLDKDGSFKPGGVVWVKMRGYPYWPAVVNSIASKANGGNSYNVKWCGSPETSDVTLDKLLDFKQNFTKRYDGKKKRKSDDYKKAVEEAKKLVEL